MAQRVSSGTSADPTPRSIREMCQLMLPSLALTRRVRLLKRLCLVPCWVFRFRSGYLFIYLFSTGYLLFGSRSYGFPCRWKTAFMFLLGTSIHTSNSYVPLFFLSFVLVFVLLWRMNPPPSSALSNTTL
jgi:hypothetical protein